MDDGTKNPAEMEEDYEPDLITLEDEAGKEHTFEVLDAADFNGQRYLAMAPYQEDASKRLAEDAEMLVMRLGTDEGGEEFLDLVDDEDELYEVGQMFLRRLSEVYDIDLNELQKELDEEKK